MVIRKLAESCRSLLWTLAVAWLALMPIQQAKATPFSFALMGDQPYNNLLETATDSLIQHMNQDSNVQWVLHVGDIKGGGEPCTNELLTRRIEQLQRSEKALLFVPGDNEWTDCHRTSNGGFDSQERLAYLRKLAFGQPTSLGKNRFPVRQQTSAPFPEHLMWRHGSTLFISLNIPGSNNDLDHPSSRKTSKAEVQRLFNVREKAIDAWLDDAEKAFSVGGADTPTETVIAIQGNPIDGSAGLFTNGYKNFMVRLVKYIDATKRPVLLVHGDTHRFKWDKPSLKKFGGTSGTDALFFRLEGWGHPLVNSWVKVTVTPGTDKPFQVNSISQGTNPAN